MRQPPTIPVRRRRAKALASLAVIIAVPAAIYVDHVSPQLRNSPLLLTLLLCWIFGGGCVVYIVSIIAAKRLHARLDATRWRLCLSCGFDLQAHGPRGACPECGRRFIIRETTEEWHRLLDAEYGLDRDDDDSSD